MLTWDAAKRRANLAKHGLDLARCEAIFDHPMVTWDDDRDVYGEPRWNALGWLDGRVVHVSFTEEEDIVRVISLRKATKHEAKKYWQTVSRHA